MHLSLLLLYIFDRLLNPSLSKGVESLLKEAAIVEDLLFKLIASFAHGSPLDQAGA
jgi:hypothetical protein